MNPTAGDQINWTDSRGAAKTGPVLKVKDDGTVVAAYGSPNGATELSFHDVAVEAIESCYENDELPDTEEPTAALVSTIQSRTMYELSRRGAGDFVMNMAKSESVENVVEKTIEKLRGEDHSLAEFVNAASIAMAEACENQAHRRAIEKLVDKMKQRVE